MEAILTGLIPLALVLGAILDWVKSKKFGGLSTVIGWILGAIACILFVAAIWRGS